ncbi:hypothetical protein L3V32_17610 [Vibrio sp. J2-4]|uniref:hypothetical protein n=1 Tax=Vibrio TaxID=662 RepID=UPI001F412167|nr:hypothetical protein [Vibrio sp. J2-4]MCF7478506.1 hypothetical protein [Vibrio sp. J2-4]
MQLIWNIIGYLMFSGVLVIFFQTFFIGIMHILMPKKIVNSYFTEPYFNTFELALFTGWPYAFFRTLMFVRLIVQPSSGKKRKLPDISKEVPRWYRSLSLLLIGIIIINSSMLIVVFSSAGILALVDSLNA